MRHGTKKCTANKGGTGLALAVATQLPDFLERTTDLAMGADLKRLNIE
jgi:hypothetical protein